MRMADPMRMPRRFFLPGTNSASKTAVFLAMLLIIGGCMTLGDDVRPPEVMIASPPVISTQPLAPDAPFPVDASLVRSLVQVTPLKTLEHKVRQMPKTPVSREGTASINPDSLMGLGPNGVRKLLGAPAHIRADDLYREWIYAESGCSFRIFFYPNLNTPSFMALKYGSDNGNGEVVDAANICIRHILKGRGNAAD